MEGMAEWREWRNGRKNGRMAEMAEMAMYVLFTVHTDNDDDTDDDDDDDDTLIFYSIDGGNSLQFPGHQLGRLAGTNSLSDCKQVSELGYLLGFPTASKA